MNLRFLFQLCAISMVLVAATAQANPNSPTPSPTASTSPAAGAITSGTPPGDWDPLADMQKMQTEMNQFFSRAMTEFGTNPNFLSMRNEPGYSSSIDVRDKGDHYEVHAFLPGSDIDNVKVTAESSNLLRVIATQSRREQKTTKLGESFTADFGEYEQLVTLPGPADSNQLKVDRKEHELIITIPKKKA